jgi:hypothetical protein
VGVQEVVLGLGDDFFVVVKATAIFEASGINR